MWLAINTFALDTAASRNIKQVAELRFLPVEQPSMTRVIRSGRMEKT